MPSGVVDLLGIAVIENAFHILAKINPTALDI
jgi:hypothetical protein